MSEHNHTHHHDYENCCDNHTPDNHGCGCCGEDHFNEHKKEKLTKIIISLQTEMVQAIVFLLRK